MTTLIRYGGQCLTSRRFVLLILLLLPLLGLAGQTRAAPLVTARYGRMAGQEVVVEISVTAPPPPTIIVIQTLPAGVSVIRAQPAANSVNPNRGKVKWLLRGVRPGLLAIRLTLDRPVSKGEISGEIRYRAPGGGRMVTMPIAGQ